MDHKADLFLSIHANSSPAVRIAGVETYYRHITTSKDALEVAKEGLAKMKGVVKAAVG